MSKYAKGIKLYHVNTRSIYRKIPQIELLYSHADFLCCSETWLDDRLDNSAIKINNMTCFRLDRKSNITDYKIHIVGGGVCIYVSSLWATHCSILDYATASTKDFEILTIHVARPNHKAMLISAVYKPPKGKIEKCTEFINRFVSNYENRTKEIWILGDFNIDLLKRDCPSVIKINSFLKRTGLKQLITNITRPNGRGGSCLDYVITNTFYVSESGVLDDLIADHLTVCCIRKKSREKVDRIFKNVRDYSKFDGNIFENLITNADWELFDNILDPNQQWDILLKIILDIFSIMCPIKKVYTRKASTPWITQEIYRLIWERNDLMKKHRRTKDPIVFRDLKRICNKLNTLIDKSKGLFIKNCLKKNVKNPKKFWRIVNGLIKRDNEFDVSDCTFINDSDGGPIEKRDIPDYLNDYFANIAERTRPVHNVYVNNNVVNREITFDFEPPTLQELYGLIIDIDTSISSCIEGLNAARFLTIFGNSLFFGIFPNKWACSTLTFLPKEGDKNNPSNWRPISQTNIFSKLLEKFVHARMLKHLQTNNLISEFQYGFLPGKSTHQAIFHFVKHLFGSMNNNKIIGSVFLDVAKAFNCISHKVLYQKMYENVFPIRL